MIEHSLGEVQGAGATLGATLSHSAQRRCPMCPPDPNLTTECGCSLDLLVCTMHPVPGEHRHCMTCGVPVFLYDTHSDGTPEYDDHECPPGFIGEGRGACKAGAQD